MMFADPVIEQAMEIDIDTSGLDPYEWLTVTIPDLCVYSQVDQLIQSSLHKVIIITVTICTMYVYVRRVCVRARSQVNQLIQSSLHKVIITMTIPDLCAYSRVNQLKSCSLCNCRRYTWNWMLTLSQPT